MVKIGKSQKLVHGKLLSPMSTELSKGGSCITVRHSVHMAEITLNLGSGVVNHLSIFPSIQLKPS